MADNLLIKDGWLQSYRSGLDKRYRRPRYVQFWKIWARCGMGLAFLCSCSVSTSPPSPEAQVRAVVVVLIDSLRPDHINAYGYNGRDTTPELDKLIEEGAHFSNAYSNAPWTIPAVMSLLTSLYPSAHGYNLEAHLYGTRSPGLSPKIKTLPQLFQDAGFLTAAFTANGAVSAEYGFARGFHTFDETKPVDGADVEVVVDRALTWLDANWRQPFFLFLHTYEVHLPHTHEKGSGAEPEDATSASEWASRAYDADLRFTDDVLARFWSGLRNKGIWDDTITVVLSDHGEALHDRTVLGRADDHGYHLFDELLRIPFIIVAPNLIREKGIRVSDAVQLVDVFPTLIELAGIEQPPMPLQGMSLVPLLQGQKLEERPLFAEAPFQGPGWITVRFNGFKYISAAHEHSHEGPEMWWDDNPESPLEALYNLRSDPGETVNVLSLHPRQKDFLRQQVERMQQSSERIRRLYQQDPKTEPSIDPESLERLRSLGYIQ